MNLSGTGIAKLLPRKGQGDRPDGSFPLAAGGLSPWSHPKGQRATRPSAGAGPRVISSLSGLYQTLRQTIGATPAYVKRNFFFLPIHTDYGLKMYESHK
jgi:hypothetical protein